MKPTLLPDTCPACNRFIDSHPECPYCGVDSPRRPLQRLLQLSAMTLSLTGLLLLFLIARASCPPTLSISQFHPFMNHGRITLAGTTVSPPGVSILPRPQQVDRASKFNSFELADHSGRITVIAPPGLIRNLSARLEQPILTPLEFTGHLYLVAGKPPRLYLDSSHPINPTESYKALHEN